MNPFDTFLACLMDRGGRAKSSVNIIKNENVLVLHQKKYSSVEKLEIAAKFEAAALGTMHLPSVFVIEFRYNFEFFLC